MAEQTVDGYIAGLEAWQAAIVSRVRELVRAAAPGAQESIKWAQPVYEANGPFAYIRAFKSSVNLGFWRGAELTDHAGALVGSGEKMRKAGAKGAPTASAFKKAAKTAKKKVKK